ncbi:MAG: hypothetical protein M4579_005971 [Chaenotheca gracillima]|nr:MAG: hypothetical protein M4579_005971 [Chaenotheca gracillima]
MSSVAIVGGTGLVGSHILSSLLGFASISSVSALARRQPNAQDPGNKLKATISADSSSWPGQVASLQPTPRVFFSALGTTRGIAGGFENQKKIDLDLNVALAKAALDAGIKIYVLISSGAVSKSSPFGYSSMKGELEEAVKELGFDKVVLVKSGLIVGDRVDSRPPEAVLRVIARFAGAISGGKLKDFWAQDADIIGKAAAHAGLQCLTGEAPPGKVWEVGGPDVMRLGKSEWKDNL